MDVIERDVVVIGAGISGLATAKCLKDDGFDCVVLERSQDIGGLWTFREHDYGVMKFTHINVSKYNYCFSDYPFPCSTPDYPHHTDMAAYVKGYADHNKLTDLVQFGVKVIKVEKTGEKWRVTAAKMRDDGRAGEETEERVVYVSSHVAISTGHHATPSYPKFPGEDTFPGEIIHSVKYNDAQMNQFSGSRVLVVGIGNSAVDAAVDCATSGRCPSVYLSTRSGAWIMPNYLMGHPTDVYANRFFFLLPRSLQNWVFETVISGLTGHPKKWGLNPKMGALQTQPTVSPTLIHHLQRGNVKVVPNITKIEGKTVHFINGVSADFDKILYCTGYKVDLPFLEDSLKSQVMPDGSNHVQLYKNVFAPSVGHSLAFIGFVQPASGGILSMSEMQARWFSALCRGDVTLPSADVMEADIQEEKREATGRWYQSARHTLQKDPIVYCDELAAMIHAKPEPRALITQPGLLWRMLFSSCGAAQYRLVGRHSWKGAVQQVESVPVPAMWRYSGYAATALLLYLVYHILATFWSIFSMIF